ncbi:excalibur calcium-binding domain-containing protein [Desulfococcaceae bacterium HSG7]|nr:excalibur calcium-binding domain-containing protein [Desulfococcaceae bacterium HSG7]
MASLTYKGKLSTWKDDKGFGFIKPEKGKQDVFIHITALKKMSRRPVIGDVILYQTSMDNKGKIRAINARIEGVKPIYSGTKKSIRSKKSGISFSQFGFVLPLIIIAVSFLVYNGVFKDKRLNKVQPKYEREEVQPIYEPKEAQPKYEHEEARPVYEQPKYEHEEARPVYEQPKYEHEEAQPVYEPKEVQPKYRCEGKVYCSEMTSCGEAMFYLRNCPGVKIDGDGDGVPCERQWCGH